MNRVALAHRKKLVCPSCNRVVCFQAARDGLGTCPNCGEWLISRGKWNRKLEQLDPEPRDNIAEWELSDEWELSIMDKLG